MITQSQLVTGATLPLFLFLPFFSYPKNCNKTVQVLATETVITGQIVIFEEELLQVAAVRIESILEYRCSTGLVSEQLPQ